MSRTERRWYRSLYWRIALGLFAFLALMLAAQSALFVWMVDQTAGSIPARTPRRLAVIVASDVAAALDAERFLAWTADEGDAAAEAGVQSAGDGGEMADRPCDHAWRELPHRNGSIPAKGSLSTGSDDIMSFH